MFDQIDAILKTQLLSRGQGHEIGRSREDRPIRSFRFGTGPQHVSLLGGCHADEPVGPRMLRHLAAYLSWLPVEHPLLSTYQWWIVPHINPDGEERNRIWHQDDDMAYDLFHYLSKVIREAPGDDVEFGFPRDEDDTGARPENRAAYGWWRESPEPFSLHVTFHGMAFAAGPWFLIEEAWKDRCEQLKQRCVARVGRMGYELHDIERHGEKGFFRLGRGFCTRPDSKYMREHFANLGDHKTAELFRPSSMETIRAFGGDPLTLVSEMPLFITPGVGEQLGPPDPVAVTWKERIDGWRNRVQAGADAQEIGSAASQSGIQSMPIYDQMVLQLTFLAAGLEQVKERE